jgi:hypothetical protein
MRFVAMTFTLLAAASDSSNLRADDAPKRSADLQVLDRFIGNWETAVIAKGTGEKFNSIESRKWSREGTFVLSEDQDVATKRESHFLITYDPKSKQYRACFINNEFTVPLLGTWDERTRTMKWISSDVPFKHESVHHFIDKDHVEWSMVVTSPEGKVVLELSAKQNRRKQQEQ